MVAAQGRVERLYLTPDRKYIHLPEGVLKARMNATPLDPDVKLRLRDACAAEQDFQCEVKRAGALKSIVEVGVEFVASGKTETRQVTLETADAWRPVNFGKLEHGPLSLHGADVDLDFVAQVLEPVLGQQQP